MKMQWLKINEVIIFSLELSIIWFVQEKNVHSVRTRTLRLRHGTQQE